VNAKQRDDKAENIFVKCLMLLEKKGHDYSGDADVLRNFRRHGSRGVLVRISDKFERLDNLASGVLQEVHDERIEDTCLDLINYVVLFMIQREEELKDIPSLEYTDQVTDEESMKAATQEEVEAQVPPPDSEDYCRGDCPDEKPSKPSPSA